MDEVTKQNDIFVSTLLNPNASSIDLLSNGINGANTGLLDPETYKSSKFVQKAFTDDKGVFNTEAFNKVYLAAAEKFNDLQQVKSFDDLSDFVKYSENDIYAPLTAPKQEKKYELQKIKNPFRESTGVKSLFETTESRYSNRELAQQHKVWDSENEKWLDYTAEDQGFLGLKYLGRQSLVYAKWDSDGTHFDKTLGREVEHRKGDWKTDDEGMYYTETAGNKQHYGDDYVAYSDILTKETDWLNKIDFFDSDDKEKSRFGTVMKTVAAVAPYMFPYVREFWGGVTAVVGISSVLPTFGKMLEGMATGDKETAFTKQMNTLENYWSKYNSSHSDAGQQSMINFETMADTVGDIFGQLYQMRAAASISKLYNLRMNKAQQESFKNFAQKFGYQWDEFTRKNPNAKFGDTAFFDLWKEAADHTPEIKEMIDRQSRLSKSLSLSYMALTSSADVYADALEHGYDRRTAGWAGVIATLGQYGIMRNNPMGDWFLDATTGYKADVSRNVMKKTLQPYYDAIAEGVDKMAKAATKEQQASVLAKIYNVVYKKGFKGFVNLLKEGGEEYWKRSLIEGVEEITEEAVMDATKAMFDGISALGWGKNSDTARFNAVDEAFSSEGAQRYLMNFLGGVLGGALFEFQGKVVQPKMDQIFKIAQAPEVTYSIVKEVMNGNTQELLDQIDRMAKADNQVIDLPVSVDGQGANITSTAKVNTRGAAVAKGLKQIVKFVDGVVADNGVKVPDNELLNKVVRDKMIQPIIEDSGVLEMMTQDFSKMVADLVQSEAALSGVVTPNEDNKNDKTKKKKESKTSDKEAAEEEPENESEKKVTVNPDKEAELRKTIEQQRAKIQAFLNGENAEEYMKIALQYLQPEIRKAVLGTDKYAFTKARYGVDYTSLPDSGAALSKEQVSKEYAEWKDTADDITKFRQIGVKAYDQMQKDFSSAIFDFVDSAYGDIRDESLEDLYGDSVLTLGRNAMDPRFLKRLTRISKRLHAANIPGINLEDKLGISEKVQKNIVSKFINTNDRFFAEMSKLQEEVRKKQIADMPEAQKEAMGITDDTLTAEDYKKQFEEEIFDELRSYPVETITSSIINEIAVRHFKPFAIHFIKQLISKLPDGISPEAAKIEVDKELVKYGFSPAPDVQFRDDVDLEEALEQYIIPLVSPRLPIQANPDGSTSEQVFDLTDQVLETYLDKKDIVDNEIILSIKRRVVNDILRFAPKIERDIKLSFGANTKLTGDEFKKLESFLISGVNNNKKIEDILDAWVEEIAKDFGKDEEDADDLKDYIKEYLLEIPSVSLYERAIKKNAAKNPLFEAFRKIGMQVFDGEDMKIFDLLATESQYMQKVPDISEYIRQGVTAEAIDNFLLKLDLLSALVVGMEQTNLSPDRQFGYNVQMARWAEKWNGGKNKDAYKTISTENVFRVQRELEMLRSKLQFAKRLIEVNRDSKWKQNTVIKNKVEDWCLEKLLEVGADLKVDGVSVFPKFDEIEKKKTTEEKLEFIWHSLHNSVRQLLEKGSSPKAVLDQLFGENGFNFNRELILGSGLASNNLSTDFKGFSEYDFFVYVVSNLAVDAYEFDYKLKEIIEQDSYKYIPFPVQEFAAKEMYSFAKDDQNIHAAAVDWLYEKEGNAINQKTTQIFFANGIAGAGKTSAVMSLVAAMLKDKKVFIAAPNKQQVANLQKSLSTLNPELEKAPAFDKNALLERFITEDGIKALNESVKDPKAAIKVLRRLEGVNKKGQKTIVYNTQLDEKYIKDVPLKDLPEIIFIDEVTHFNQAELIALDTIAAKYGIKLITSGDTLQKGALIDGSGSNINDVFSFKAPALTISVRSSNVCKKDNTDVLQVGLREVENLYQQEYGFAGDSEKSELVKRVLSGFQLKYYEERTELNGDKLVDEITVQDLERIKAAISKGGGSLAIITKLNASGEIADEALKSKLNQVGLVENRDYQLYTAEDAAAKSVQGSEADYVIINDYPDPNIQEDPYAAMQALYTYLSRSVKGSLMVDKGAEFRKAFQISNIKQSYSGAYETPGIEMQAKLKGERVKQLESIVEGFTPRASRVKAESAAEEAEAAVVSGGSPVKTTTDETDTFLEKKEFEEVLEAQKRQVEKKEESIAKQEEANSIEWRPTDPYGYLFYNRLGIATNAAGRSFSTENGTSTDLDGLFGGKNKYVNKRIIRGFIKFKNLIAIYPDVKMDEFKEGLNDRDILYFFYHIIPSVVDPSITDMSDILQEVKSYLLDGHL